MVYNSPSRYANLMGWIVYTAQDGLYELLERAGMSQAELASRLGLHPHTVTNWRGHAPQYALAYLRLYVSVREAIA